MSYNKIDPKIKKRWCKELRSGKHQQGTSTLGYRPMDPTAPPYFCCLGVLVEHCGIKGKLGAKWINEFTGDTACNLGVPGQPRNLGVPDSIGINTARLRWRGQQVVGLDETAEGVLINLNDRGASFDTIADWIEENL